MTEHLTRADQIAELPDGTYLFDARTKKIENYADRWAGGYIVGLKELDRDPHDWELFGVWVDPDTGVRHVDLVRHVFGYLDAVVLARGHNQKAIWDLRNQKAIEVE